MENKPTLLAVVDDDVLVATITAYDTLESCERTLRLGANTDPRKPVDDEAQRSAVGTAIGAGSA